MGVIIVYDWSTGLIFKGGRYFDPSLGIWLTGPFMIVMGLWRPRKRRKKKKGRLGRGQRIISLLLVLLLVTVPMIGCEESPQQETPSPTATETCTPESTQPAGLPTDPAEESTPTETSTPVPTPTQQPPPTNTPSPTPTQPPSPTPTPSKPLIWEQLPVVNPTAIQWYGNTVFAYKATYTDEISSKGYENFAGGFHPGIDLLAPVGTPVFAGTRGTVISKESDEYVPYGSYAPGRIDIKHTNTGKWLLYGHLERIPDSIKHIGASVEPNTLLGYLDSSQHHLHLEVWTGNWGSMTNPLPYFSPALQAQLIAKAKSQNDSRVTFFQNQSRTIPEFLVNRDTQPDIIREAGRYLEEHGYISPSTSTPAP